MHFLSTVRFVTAVCFFAIAASARADQQTNVAMDAWFDCVANRARDWSALSEAADVIAVGVLGACRSEEQAFRIAAHRGNRPAAADALVAEFRQKMRELAVEVVLRQRAATVK